MAPTPHFLSQPPEVHHAILAEVDTLDLARLNQTCRQLRDCIAHDNLLWKRHYLKQFDCPASHINNDRADDLWQSNLKSLIRLQKTLESKDQDVKTSAESFDQVYSSINSLLVNSTPNPTKNIEFLTTAFRRPENIFAYLSRSSIFAAARYYTASQPLPQVDDQPLSAKLFVYYGIEIDPPSLPILTNPVHPFARSRLYDLRRYNAKNLWGPFLDDGTGSTDWEKVQCILVDLLYNMKLDSVRRGRIPRRTLFPPPEEHWARPFTGLGANSFVSKPLPQPHKEPLNPELMAQDPYGVTGTWMRVVCFLDYSDLWAFNFESPPISLEQHRPPIDTREAFRLIRLHLEITNIEYDDEATGEAKGKPIVSFEGKSRSMNMAWDPNANSGIRGTVRTTPSGDIRWTTFSIFHGEERWRSEGVQIGSIKSARGIIGNWFDKDYDVHGPAGPTCFWKISDDIQAEKKAKPWSSTWGGLWSATGQHDDEIDEHNQGSTSEDEEGNTTAAEGEAAGVNDDEEWEDMPGDVVGGGHAEDGQTVDIEVTMEQLTAFRQQMESLRAGGMSEEQATNVVVQAMLALAGHGHGPAHGGMGIVVEEGEEVLEETEEVEGETKDESVGE